MKYNKYDIYEISWLINILCAGYIKMKDLEEDIIIEIIKYHIIKKELQYHMEIIDFWIDIGYYFSPYIYFWICIREIIKFMQIQVSLPLVLIDHNTILIYDYENRWIYDIWIEYKTFLYWKNIMNIHLCCFIIIYFRRIYLRL